MDSPPSARPALDLSYAVKAPFQDPQWLTKGLVLGMIVLIPLIGFMVVLGWAREVYDRGLRGEGGLPEVDFGRQLSYGVAPAVAMFNLSLVVMGLMIGLGVAGAGVYAAVQPLLDSDALDGLSPLLSLAMFGAQALAMAVMLGMQVLAPELMRRGFNGDLWPLFSPAASIDAIRAQPANYLITFIGFMVANMLGGLGVIACYVGLLVTMPIGYAISANLIAQWDRSVRGGDQGLAGLLA